MITKIITDGEFVHSEIKSYNDSYIASLSLNENEVYKGGIEQLIDELNDIIKIMQYMENME